MMRALLVLSVMAVLPATAGAAPFHAPKSAVEVALDKMLHRADADNDQLGNLLGRPDADHKVDYRTMLTPQLIATLRAEEKAEVQRDCGGVYKDGEICGFDFLPMTCAQDTAAHYFYRTLATEPDKVTIAYAWPTATTAAATYTLVHGKSGWRISNIVCDGE